MLGLLAGRQLGHLGTASQLQGNLMALASVTMTTGASIRSGRALARGAALTLDDNQITPPAGACAALSTTVTSGGVPETGAADTPLQGLGVAMLIGRRNRCRRWDRTQARSQSPRRSLQHLSLTDGSPPDTRHSGDLRASPRSSFRTPLPLRREEGE
jgi:hypothetical protein